MVKEATTKARQLIDGQSLGPEAVKAIGEAFDAAGRISLLTLVTISPATFPAGAFNPSGRATARI